VEGFDGYADGGDGLNCWTDFVQPSIDAFHLTLIYGTLLATIELLKSVSSMGCMVLLRSALHEVHITVMIYHFVMTSGLERILSFTMTVTK